ncbi:LytR/AlgR family response regulator transcription factor [Gemmatimonas groenlandica]|uniref:Response regulator transcription factor n=1 Tax=Gemmatimonas groenlandica TaxID=2732249 RepID=A0A6M4IQB7_9BACT|nr:LytTR family DNA-binding domain-containing protein [Gemmatimonas groenlandica]QJR35687.1 response regulator transcription factor [Gemmatimonas groenlandica]
MISALIIDDEPPARRQLRRLLAAWSDIQVIGEADSAATAVQRIRASPPDLVFLDIALPDGTGIDVVESVGPLQMPLTVFVTAYDVHAVQAFALSALDYLLKPVEPERLHVALERARDRLRASAPNTPSAETLSQLSAVLGVAPTRFRRRWLVDDGRRQLFVRTDTIDWIEAIRHGVALYIGAERYELRLTLSHVKGQLDPEDFVQVNRSQIVNLRSVKEVQPWSHGDAHLVLQNGRRLSWSRRFRRASEQ